MVIKTKNFKNMKKIILTFLCGALGAMTGFSQQLIIPGYASAYSDVQIGDGFITTITNTASGPLCLFARLDGFGSDAEQLFWSDSAALVWLYGQINQSHPWEQQQLESILAMERVLKSPLFMNRHLIWNEWGSVSQTAKKYSWVGIGHSIYNQQCGDYARILTEQVAKTNLFSWQDLRGNNVGVSVNGIYTGLHVVAEASINNRFVKIDADPGMPRAQDFNPASQNGFASTEDIVNDTLLVGDTSYVWLNEQGDSIQLTHQSITRYRSVFGEHHPFSWFQAGAATYELSPIITLPPGASMSTWYIEDYVLLDLTGYSDSVLAVFEALYDSGDIDTIVNAIMMVTGLSETVVHDAVVQNRLGLMPIPYWPGYDSERILPYITIHVPVSSDTTFLGTDLSAPFLVRKIKVMNGQVQLGDTLISDEATFVLFDTILVAGREAPIVGDKEVQYLSEGYITPGADVMLTLYYNPRYYNFWDGFSFDILCGESPSVSQEFLTGPNHVITGIRESSDGILLYPNPVSAGSPMSILSGTNICDIYGRPVLVSGFAPGVPGIYFVLFDGRWQKLSVR